MSKGNAKLNAVRKEIQLQLVDIAQKQACHHDGRTFPIPDIEILHAAPDSHVYSSKVDGLVESEDEGYRCKCAFQLVIAIQCPRGNVDCSSANDLIYVVREHGEIIPLEKGIFPPANRRIRSAMTDLKDCLNTLQSADIGGYEFHGIRNNLTSVTFVSSWGDNLLAGRSGDCHVTLHYGPPGPFTVVNGNGLAICSNAQYNESDWKSEAQKICNQCNLSSITARAKGIKISVFNSAINQICNSECIICDDLWITMQHYGEIPEIVDVSLLPPSYIDSSCQTSSVKVQYQKASDAFQHPNAGVMLTSLHWILSALSRIAKESANTQKPCLLEMYCGCGAHTIPIAKSGILSEIVAIELDERLVHACKRNCILNECLKGESVAVGTKVSVFKGNAAMWAKKTLKSNHKQYINLPSNDVLLVDPPREGLDKAVCELALKGPFQYVIYISCGRRALLRDLDIMCMGGFDVDDLAVIDLFPGTDAVESLVLLKRSSVKQ